MLLNKYQPIKVLMFKKQGFKNDVNSRENAVILINKNFVMHDITRKISKMKNLINHNKALI